MKIFVSWSGPRSNAVAEVVKAWIEHIFPNVDVWISSQDMRLGQLWATQVVNNLYTSEYGVFCFTKNNCMSPWMMFEAGAISKQGDTSNEIVGVTGIIFDGEIRDMASTPFGIFQGAKFDKKSMNKLFKDINNIVGQPLHIDSQRLSRNVDDSWGIYYPKIMGVLGDSSFGGSAVDKAGLMAQLTETNFGVPCEGEVVHYEKGFEDYPLYEILLKNATKRFWVLGRKNRKLFDSRNLRFLQDMKAKNGFDFRCLFLDPDAPKKIIESAQDTLDFPTKLATSIRSAFKMVSDANMNPSDVLRLYSTNREYAVIVVDDVVLYSPILFKNAELEDVPIHLTQAAFNLVSVKETLAQLHMNQFEKLWGTAKPLAVLPVLPS